MITRSRLGVRQVAEATMLSEAIPYTITRESLPVPTRAPKSHKEKSEIEILTLSTSTNGAANRNGLIRSPGNPVPTNLGACRNPRSFGYTIRNRR